MQTIPQPDSGNEPVPGLRVPVTIRIPKSIDRQVEIAAAMRDCSKQQLIEDALRMFLGQQAAA
jgi:predicted transcriptional regulator